MQAGRVARNKTHAWGQWHTLWSPCAPRVPAVRTSPGWKMVLMMEMFGEVDFSCQLDTASQDEMCGWARAMGGGGVRR